jgi:hypothetical protein
MDLQKIKDDTFVELWVPHSEPEISILMPVYRQKRYVAPAVSSVLSQEGIVAEVVFSDDGSQDGTFEEAFRVISSWLEKHGCAHRILVRRGSRRRWRDHLALLADNSSCDVVCQAHGDDLSTSDRCRRLVSVFKADPFVSMVASEAASFVKPRRCVHNAAANGRCDKAYQYSYSEIIDGSEFLIGSSLAWRKSAVRCFQRLDGTFTGASHDRILAFRASLTGKVMLLPAPLVEKRMHLFQASRLVIHEPTPNCGFGQSLFRVNELLSMKKDLYRAADQGLTSQEEKRMLEEEINKRLEVFQQSLVEALRIYTNSGKHIAWVDDHMIERMNINVANSIKLHIPRKIVMPLRQLYLGVRSFSAGLTSRWKRKTRG